MNLQRTEILSFKLSSFSRSFATEAGVVLANGFFISRFGANNWPQLFLFAQFLTTAFLFASLSLSAKTQNTVYRFLVWAAAIGCASFAADVSQASILYVVSGLLLCLDFLAGSVTYQFMVRHFSLAENRVMNHSVTELELWGRVVGTLALSALTYFGQSQWAALLISIFAVVHILSFLYVSQKLAHRSQVRSDTCEDSLGEKLETSGFGSKIVSQLRSLSTSRLFMVAVSATLLAQIFKFFVSYSFFKSLEVRMLDREQTTAIISQLNLVAIFCSIFFQRFLSQSWLLHKSPRFLFTVTPILLVVVALASFVGYQYQVLVFQFVLLSCFNKAIQAPSIRHTLMAIPRARERNVIYASSVFVALAMLLWSFSAEQFRGLLNVERSQAALFGVSLFALFLFRRVNFYYYLGLLESVFGPRNFKKRRLSRHGIEEVERGRLIDEFLKASPDRAVELTPFLKRRFKGFEGSAYLKYQLKAIEEAYLSDGFGELTAEQRAQYLRILYLFALKHIESTGFWAVDELFRRSELQSLERDAESNLSYDEQTLYLFYEFFLQSNEKAPLRSVRSAMTPLN